MMTNAESRLCRECHAEYHPEYLTVLKTKLLRGDGYCPKCAQKVYEEEIAKEEAMRLAGIARTRRQQREKCGIPPKFMNEDFSTFKKGWQDKALKRCIDYAERFPVDRWPVGYLSLYLWSSVSWGTGKTHLSVAICHRILDRWNGTGEKGCPRIVFISEPELFRRIQATYSFTREESQTLETEDDIIKSIIYADLVVLDDVGKEPRRDMQFVRKILFAIVNGRYAQHLPLIITANLVPAELNRHLDEPPSEASYNRFFEMIGGKSVHMDGKSYRTSSESKSE